MKRPSVSMRGKISIFRHSYIPGIFEVRYSQNRCLTYFIQSPASILQDI